MAGVPLKFKSQAKILECDIELKLSGVFGLD